MRKAEKLFQLVNLMRARQPVTAQSLAGELGVSVRTVYRYIVDLSISGIPIYGEPGVGYHVHKHFELPPLTLSAEEIEALLLGVQMVSISTGVRLPAAARSLLGKIDTVLPDLHGARLRQSAHALSVGDRHTSSALWDALQGAVAAQRVIRFQYISQDGTASERTAWPLGLFYWGGKWTIGAWCLLRQAFREFRVDRITNIDILDRTFAPTTEINLAHYMQQQADTWTRVPALLTPRCQ
jgi:predicted DNA-binding transcriptional regulator YafY